MKRSRIGTIVINSMGYDAQCEILEIEFRIDGQVWRYSDVPEHVWYTFRNAFSIDLYYFQDISGRYSEKLIYSKKLAQVRESGM